MTLRIATFLNIPREIRSSIIELVIYEYSETVRLVLSKKGAFPVTKSNLHSFKTDVSFWGGQLMLTCKQLYDELMPFFASSVVWEHRYWGGEEVPRHQRRSYLEHAKSIKIAEDFAFEFPVSYCKLLMELKITQVNVCEPRFSLSTDPQEAHQHFAACISIADRSFFARAKNALLKQNWARTVFENPGRTFRISHTLNVVNQGRYELVSLSVPVFCLFILTCRAHRPSNTILTLWNS